MTGYDRRNSDRRYIVLRWTLILVPFAALVVLMIQQRSSLDASTRVTCQFIASNATTRLNQARNADTQVAQEHVYIAAIKHSITLTEAVIGLQRNPEGQTPQERASTATFFSYLDGEVALRVAQQHVWETLADATAKNIRLSRALAAQANRLAHDLDCT